MTRKNNSETCKNPINYLNLPVLVLCYTCQPHNLVFKVFCCYCCRKYQMLCSLRRKTHTRVNSINLKQIQIFTCKTQSLKQLKLPFIQNLQHCISTTIWITRIQRRRKQVIKISTLNKFILKISHLHVIVDDDSYL